MSDACRYEPTLNETVRDFARHYAVSILPARPFMPKDKATAESAVQVVTRWILARLRHAVLADVHAADAAISALLASLNERPFQKLDGCRASLFAALDSPALTPLPAQPWQWATFKTVKAHIDYHVEVEFHRYSVPHSLVGLELEARITDALVEVLHRGQRVACHARSNRRGGFTTVDEHMPAAHRGAQAVDARAADPLGCGHRPEHGPVRRPAAAALQASRARLPQLPWTAESGQALRPREAGGGLHVGAGAARRALPPRARHPGQRARPDRTPASPRPSGWRPLTTTCAARRTITDTTCNHGGAGTAEPTESTESTEYKDPDMMMNNTLAQLRELKLVGMATAVEEQLSSTAAREA